MVCPNFISNEHLDAVAPEEITGEPKVEGEIRIGYTGGHTHFGDVALLARPLTEVCLAYPQVKLIFFGYPPVLPLQHRITAQFFMGIEPGPGESTADFMLRYYREIAAMKLDIALAPLEDNAFNECKSNIKLLEYGINGVPIAASNVGPYATDYEGHIYRNFDAVSWQESLVYLIDKVKMRQTLASENLEFIRTNHTARQSLGAWEKVLERAAKVPC